jgi:pSer/pThr/pTyr-binding forkhead associated (FHA) protein
MKAVLIGPQGKTILKSAVLTVGSSPENSLVINSVKVSAHHAEIRPEGQGYSITDLGSIHGTYVNGERLDFSTPHMLNPGNSITIGDSTFTYELEEEPKSELGPPAMPGEASNADTLSSDTDNLLPQTANGTGIDDTQPENQQLMLTNPASTYPQQYMTQNPPQPYMQPIYAEGYVSPIPGYVPIEQVRRRNRRLLLWGGLGLVVVIALAVAGYFYFTRSTPEKTLDTYCNALMGQDYLTAYNQLASSLQNAEPENQFANILDAQGHFSTCKHGSTSVNGSVVSVNLTTVSGANQTSSVVTLVQDKDSTWKISMPLPPSMTLMTFCHALKNGDYQTAYNQLAGNVKNQLSEAAYEAANRQTVTQAGGITNCTVSNVNQSGSSALGTITFILGNGQSSNTDYSLVDESGFWRINGAR